MSDANPSVEMLPAPGAASQFRRRADLLVPVVLLVVATVAALTVDPVRNGYGLKGDEASYTSMALSLAHDGDLVFERADLERFFDVYRVGPDGIFLKRGKLGRFKLSSRPPFVRHLAWGVGPVDRLYYGKAFIYPLAAAPFVRVFGLNGILLLHVLLYAGVGACGYRFLRARSPRAPSLAFTLAFFGASIVPVYAVWFTAESFNLALAFFACFLWLYKEVAPPVDRPGRTARFVRGPWSDLLAAALFGMMTFSKPLYALLALLPVLWSWRRLQFLRGLAAGLVFLAVAGGLFGVNLITAGEWNYQGGDRKVFYGVYPTQGPELTFETVGFRNSTNQLDKKYVADPRAYVERLARNVMYFCVGRHSGLVPFFFPGVVALALRIWRYRDIRGWHVLMVVALVATVMTTLVILPYTWSGGGGPPGNRYFMGLYPLLFFLIPPFRSLGVPLAAWIGGALVTAQLVLNPYYTSRFAHVNLDHGINRLLPVELTMVNDLPIMLDRFRSRLPYGENPMLLLYLLDENVYPPDDAGIWFSGRRRGEVIVRTDDPLASMRISVSSAVPNRVRVSFDGRSRTIDVLPGGTYDIVIPTSRGVYSDGGYSYVLSVAPERGMAPRLVDSTSTDKRYLGAMVRLQGTTAK